MTKNFLFRSIGLYTILLFSQISISCHKKEHKPSDKDSLEKEIHNLNQRARGYNADGKKRCTDLSKNTDKKVRQKFSEFKASMAKATNLIDKPKGLVKKLKQVKADLKALENEINRVTGGTYDDTFKSFATDLDTLIKHAEEYANKSS